MFSGSFRASFANDDWRSFTPYELKQIVTNPTGIFKINKTVPTYEATIGDPEDRKNFETLGTLRKEYSAQREIYLTQVTEGKKEAAAVTLRDKLLPAFQQYFQGNNALVEYNKRNGEAMSTEAVAVRPRCTATACARSASSGRPSSREAACT